MNSKQLPALGDKSFESIKLTNEHGAEYWSARDLQLLLGYSQWRRFEQAVERAITSCEQSGNKPDYHFAGAGKMIEVGKGGQRDVDDYHLSRFACYLIAQNGDPRKPEIAQAQKYFAVQARRQELNNQAAADMERLELRKQTAEEFKALSGAAQDAGVQSKMFGVFHDAGYKGLYAPSDAVYWQHGHSTERDFIYVTTASLTHEQLQQLSDEVGPDRTLLVLCTAFRAKADAYPNLTVKKIPKQVLSRCEWGHDDYSLQVENLPKEPPKPGQQSLFDGEA